MMEKAQEIAQCPCGTGKSYQDCCRPCHCGETHAPSAVALMRSRYAAYVLGEIEYLAKTIPLLERKEFDRRGAKEWSESAQWLGLEILGDSESKDGKTASVEFIAKFKTDGQVHKHHELSKFKRQGERWFFVDGKLISNDEQAAPSASISRNAPCPCGSGKKYKKCCG